MNYITINKPIEVKSQRVKNEVEKLYRSGLKMSEIKLQMTFICDNPDAICKDFQVIKNKIAFKVREEVKSC